MDSMNLDEILEDLIAGEELMLVDMTLAKVGRSHVIRILVDCPGRVNHGQCAKLSRIVKNAIEKDMLLNGENYRLEVSSPGVGRLLRRVAFRLWRLCDYRGRDYREDHGRRRHPHPE